MLPRPTFYPLVSLLAKRLSWPGRVLEALALFVEGTIWGGNVCLDTVAASRGRYGQCHTLRRQWRELTYDDSDRIDSWGPDTEWAVAPLFPPWLTWILGLWVGRCSHLVLALDPTHRRDEWVVLTVSVLYRHHALPVAWHVVPAQAQDPWMSHFRRLRRQLAPAVPPGTRVHVLCDEGLSSPDLWQQIVDLGGHPVVRYQPHLTFRPAGAVARVPVTDLRQGPGTYGVGEGEAFRDHPRPCTLVAVHDPGGAKPWILLTNTPAQKTDPSLYAWRHGIEPHCRGWKTRGLRWPRTRRLDPARTARHLRVIAVACLLALAYATRQEDALTLGVAPRHLRRPPPDPVIPRRPRPLSLFSQGLILLRDGLARGRLWTGVWLSPTPGPDKTAGLRCLSPRGA